MVPWSPRDRPHAICATYLELIRFLARSCAPLFFPGNASFEAGGFGWYRFNFILTYPFGKCWLNYPTLWALGIESGVRQEGLRLP